MPALRVHLPYESVPVRVRLGYGDELSRIEVTVLRAVVELWNEQLAAAPGADPAHAGGVGLSRLNTLFGLGYRMTLDLVFDLWRREYITLDLYRARVAPTPAVVAAFAQGEQQRLSSGEFKLETIDVWLDRVGGHLTGRSGSARPPDPELAVPSDALFSATVDDVSGSDLVRAAQETLSERGQARGAAAGAPIVPHGRNLRVMETRLVPAHQRPGARRRAWFPVDITVRLDPDTELVRVTVVQDSRRSLAQCERIGRLLTQFLEQRPGHRFSQKLRASVETRLADPPSLERSINRLTGLAGQALTASAGTRDALHEQLTDALRTARSQVEARVGGEARVDLLRAQEDYRAALRSVIERARRQVVLVASTVRYEGLADLLPDLRAAVARGVQLVLLWGRRHSDRIEQKAENVLEELRMEAAGRRLSPSTVLVARRSANVSANMVVADNHTALVGGYGYLGLLDKGTDQLGVVVSAQEPGGCEPVESILRWARRAMPDGITASAVHFRERDFPGHEEGWTPPAERLPWTEPPAPLEQDTAASDAAVRSWALAWRNCAAEVRRTLNGRTRPSVTLVEDAAHRDALWDGVRAAERQVVVAGEHLATTVVSRRLTNVLRERLGAGVRVDVLFRHVRKGSDDAEERLAELAAEAPAAFGLHEGRSSARALVCDDELVVGSFDFLAHEGFYSGQPGRRPPAEVGLRVSGGGVAGEAAVLLGAPAVHRRRPRAGEAHLAHRRSHRLLATLDACTDPAQRAQVVTEAVGAPDLAGLLAELREAQAPDELLRITAAAALRGRTDGPEPALREWAGWLLEDLWSRGRFVEAWVLGSALPDCGPPPLLARTAATLGTPAVADALEECALQDGRTPGRTAALIAVGAAQVLAWPGRGGTAAVPPEVALRVREALRYLAAKDVAPCWAKLADAAVSCPPELDDPGPAAIARRQLAREYRNSSLDEAWEALDEALSSATETKFSFEAGLKTNAHLFHANGLFGELRSAAERRDLFAAAAWTQRPELADLPGFLDRTTAEIAAGLKNHVIHSSKRRAYLERLRRVEAAAGAVVAFRDERTDATAAYQVEPAQALAGRLSGLWPELRADPAEQTAAERHLTEHALGQMGDIREWGTLERS